MLVNFGSGMYFIFIFLHLEKWQRWMYFFPFSTSRIFFFSFSTSRILKIVCFSRSESNNSRVPKDLDVFFFLKILHPPLLPIFLPKK